MLVALCSTLAEGDDRGRLAEVLRAQSSAAADFAAGSAGSGLEHRIPRIATRQIHPN
jgi:hypothetical protein